MIAEAFKNDSPQRILFAVPAPLVDQYFEEILGEIRGGEMWSCTSQCIIKSSKNGDPIRDFYTNMDTKLTLESKITALQQARNKLDATQLLLDTDPSDVASIKKYKTQEIRVAKAQQFLKQDQEQIKSRAIKVFEITTHTKFINELFQSVKGKNTMIRQSKITNDSALLNKNGVLIIDEIQRLVSVGGIFYKKLYNAIKYYCHPEMRLVLLSATPIYDNPYELALTINLLRPRIPFPTKKDDFYKYFIGEYDEDKDECISSDDKFLTFKSCLINKDMIRYLCAGYISYFKGGNPVAYPYKRVITMEHVWVLSKRPDMLRH